MSMRGQYSFRFLLIKKDGSVQRITQDIRRKRNVITGIVQLSKPSKAPFNCWNAKTFDCKMIVREV